MSEQGTSADPATATGNDYAEHIKSYGLFVGLTKWGTIGCATILILMAIFLL